MMWQTKALDPTPLDPKHYFEHVVCPHPGCGQKSKVVFRFDQLKGWFARIEEHEISAVQITADQRNVCSVRYLCPASLALVSPLERIK